MLFLLQEGQDLFLGDTDSFICNPIKQIGNSEFFTPFNDPVFDFFFEDFGHPDHPRKSAVTDNELALGDIELGMAHKTR